jgi:putative membrane protein
MLFAVLVPTYRKLPLSDLSYAMIFVFLALHEWGAHYKYYDVPLGEWMKPWLHTDRNMYDRVVHFSYGLFMSYPLQELLMRKIGVKPLAPSRPSKRSFPRHENDSGAAMV